MKNEKGNLLPEIIKTVILNAPIEKVWKAVSTSEGIEEWWMPNNIKAVTSTEFVLHTGQFGDSPCRVTEVEPPFKIAFDWDQDWHIIFQLKKLDEERTEFTLIHSGWDPDKRSRFGQPYSDVRSIMDDGWERIVKEKLPEYVSK